MKPALRPDHRRFARRAANDNRAAMFEAARARGEAAVERLLGIAGALRFALLLVGI